MLKYISSTLKYIVNSPRKKYQKSFVIVNKYAKDKAAHSDKIPNRIAIEKRITHRINICWN